MHDFQSYGEGESTKVLVGVFSSHLVSCYIALSLFMTVDKEKNKGKN